MARSPSPPIAAAISFIDGVNRGDLVGLTELMIDDHVLDVLDEPLLVGRRANRDAWRGHFSSFPDYVIYPRLISADGASVAVLGVTTGSHLGLPDEEEMRLGVIWLAHVVDGRLSSWRVADDTPELRVQLGIPPTV
jgi:ketosteroid isomerase-like protein